MWPSFGSRLGRRLNRALLLGQLRPVVEQSRGPVVAVTTIPLVADLVRRLPVSRWVYYCVDDYEEWPGSDRHALRATELAIVRNADEVIAASEALRDKIGRLGREAHLLTHGVDLDRWLGGDPPALPPGFGSGLERPWIVFWGLVDRRLDVNFLRRLASDLDQGTILLVGPAAESDPRLSDIPRLRRLSALPQDRLPALGREADLLIMPYDDLPVTRAMQPLKLLEYLATGKPVVVRDLPANRAWADALDMAESPEAFSRLVRRRLVTGLPSGQVRSRERLREEGWDAKAADFERWVFEPLAMPREAPSRC
jgi:glycosyltransferase involved in cell wall biosynthesis